MPEVVAGEPGNEGGAGSGGFDAPYDGPGHDAPPGDGPDSGAEDAPAAPVALGIVPVPRAGDASPTPLDEATASLEVLSAGARGVSLVRRWDALYADTGAPDAAAWSRLGVDAVQYRDAGRSLLLCFAVVDRSLDARPAQLAGDWDAPEVLDAMDAAIDDVFATFGPELAYLSFGYELDRRLAESPVADGKGLVALVMHALEHARSHPNRPAGTRVGVTATADALGAPSPELSKLVVASDAVIATYVPVSATFQARLPASAADDLDALAAAVAGDGGARSVVLQEVGYPSAAKAGSSPEQQDAFYVALFQALSSRRDRFPFVSVRGLHDAWPGACAADAEAVGAPANAKAEALYCSLGLKEGDGNPKPAWETMKNALATFADP